MGPTSGNPKNRRASSGVASISMLIFIEITPISLPYAT